MQRNGMVEIVITDAQGAFLIKFDESYYKDPPQDSLPDLFFKVFRNDELIWITGYCGTKKPEAQTMQVVQI